MSTFKEKIVIEGFSVEEIDTSEIDQIAAWLPRNGIVDVNIAEQGIIMTLHGQNICQEKIIQIERWIGLLENERNKRFSKAMLQKAVAQGLKTQKDREVFATADEDYILTSNELTIAKAAKKWLENKAAYFSSWHYALKSFLRRDYGLEKLGNFQAAEFSEKKEENFVEDIQWSE